MLVNKILPSKRAAVAIASIISLSAGGYVTMSSGYKVHDDVALASTYLIGPWEGRELVAYLDKLAKPPVVTICDGDTTNVKLGMRETPAGCDKRLQSKMETVYRPALVRCVIDFDKHPVAWRAMADSIAWNIGPRAACDSTAIRIVNDAMRKKTVPDYVASCKAATAFNKAGGKVYIGLVNRREMGDKSRIGEAEMCVTGAQR
ncbi:lysozyme protein [Rhizobium phage RHph_Y5A]|nr:lysozyme protein [Rhizobium phage RHph_Y5A]